MEEDQEQDSSSVKAGLGPVLSNCDGIPQASSSGVKISVILHHVSLDHLVQQGEVLIFLPVRPPISADFSSDLVTLSEDRTPLTHRVGQIQSSIQC